MVSVNPRPASHAPPTGGEMSTPIETVHNERGMMTCGMERSSGFMILAVIALAVVVVAGLSFGWSGWLTASVGGISLLFVLPCLAMCVGMIWMMIRGGTSRPPTK